MTELARERVSKSDPAVGFAPRPRIAVVSSDVAYAESLRSHLAAGFDVLMARNAGEAAAKALSVHINLVIVDLGKPVLGIPALSRMRELKEPPIICGLAPVDDNTAQSQFEFDFVLARPSSGADLPDRVKFILAKKES
jgi:DNA-binding response OmpR family regulator